MEYNSRSNRASNFKIGRAWREATVFAKTFWTPCEYSGTRISKFRRFHETKQAQNEVGRFFYNLAEFFFFFFLLNYNFYFYWPNLFSNSFATVGEFKRHFKRYSVDILHDFEGFSFPRRFIYLRGIAFSGLFRWNFRKVRVLFILLTLYVHSRFTSFIFATRTLDFVVKFRSVFKHEHDEAAVFRRSVLTFLSASLLQKFQAYLVYLSLIWNKNPRP